MLPFAAVYTARNIRGSLGSVGWATVYGVVVMACLLTGIAVSFSRAGIALGIVAVLGSAFLIWRFSNAAVRFGRWPIIGFGSALVLFAVILQVGFVDLLVQRSAVDESRVHMRNLTGEAIQEYNYAGSGFGTFVPVFKSFEGPFDITKPYINHAHNDWLELTLEGGIVAVSIMVGFLGWFGSRIWSVWLGRPLPEHMSQRMLASAASLTIAMLLLHSLLDYPLRTTALLSWFALACAFLCSPGAATSDRREEARV